MWFYRWCCDLRVLFFGKFCLEFWGNWELGWLGMFVIGELCIDWGFELSFGIFWFEDFLVESWLVSWRFFIKVSDCGFFERLDWVWDLLCC